LQPGKDMRIGQGFYAVMPSPVDGTVWGTLQATGPAQPGAALRINPGPSPPETALSEIYNVPLPGFGPRGGDIDSKGVVWVSLASGHLGSFDRRKCKGPLNGPTATGNLNDGLIAYADGKMITMKVPYPTGFYAKGLDGRIDDPKAGWKGRGLWTSSGDRTPWHQEGGKGMTPMAVHFQVRPSPLAD